MIGPLAILSMKLPSGTMSARSTRQPVNPATPLAGDYLEVGDRGFSIRMTRVPELAEVPYAVKMEPNLVVEYYAS